MNGTVYLIPSFLSDEAPGTIPASVIEAVKNCQLFYVENERSARRFLKKLWKEMIIDDFGWFVIDKSEPGLKKGFLENIKAGKNIGIISEAGCPGIADPGQELIAVAQGLNAPVKPLVGPNSILLALMASGMNGQHFQFCGYLPIKDADRVRTIKSLESESVKKNCTQIFIETPYRNNQLLECILKNCNPSTKICLAANLTADDELIKTKTVREWRNERVDLHKRPTIFLMLSQA